MKQLSLEEIQNVSLDVLKDVHTFCVNNNINYSLAYGSLIGAFRHKGFIPWDDDIDIIMLRPDYERFCNTYQSPYCKLITPKDSFINYARVCDAQKTTYITQTPWTNDANIGVWIDVFPIDAVEDEKALFSLRIDRLKPLLDNQVKARKLFCKFRWSINPLSMYRFIKERLDYSNLDVFDIKDRIDEIVAEIKFGETNHCSQLVCRGNKDREFFTFDMFKDYFCVPFGNTEFMVSNGWKEILELNYGDFMQLPPIEQQKPHGGFVKFYWR